MLAKPLNRKRAVEYLRASGAVPITVIERDGVCSIYAGGKSRNSRNLVSTRRAWPEKPAGSLATVRTVTATAALARSATVLKATLTPDDVAIARADDARDYALVASPPRNHLNCGTVGTVMRGGAIGATLEAFPNPLGSVT